MRDEELNQKLQRRVFEPAGADFAQRIIATAACTAQVRPLSMMDMLAQALTEFLPRPAMAMACVLVIGVLVGVQMPEMTPSDSEWAQDLFDDEETVL